MMRSEVAAIVTMVILICAACSRTPGRPEAVPASAVFVPAAKGGYWHACRLDASGQCKCTIYLTDGRIVYHDFFLPYEGSPPTETQLVVSSDGTGDTVKLANGQLLLPKSEYEMRKRYWDWRLGKAATP